MLAGIVFTIGVGMIDLRGILRESPGEFTLAAVTGAAVVAIGVEQGILLAIALLQLRNVRHSCRPHTSMLAPDAPGRLEPVPAAPGTETEPGLIDYRFGADLFYANENRLADEMGDLVRRAPAPLRWFVVDAGAITDLDYSAARTVRELCEDLRRAGITLVFGRVNPYLRADMERHGITGAIGPEFIFTTLHEALAAVRGGAHGAAGGER